MLHTQWKLGYLIWATALYGSSCPRETVFAILYVCKTNTTQVGDASSYNKNCYKYQLKD